MPSRSLGHADDLLLDVHSRHLRQPRKPNCLKEEAEEAWVAVQDRKLSYHNPETYYLL